MSEKEHNDVPAGIGKQSIWIRSILFTMIAVSISTLVLKVIPDLVTHGIVKLPATLKLIFFLLLGFYYLFYFGKREYLHKILFYVAVTGIASIILDFIFFGLNISRIIPNLNVLVLILAAWSSLSIRSTIVKESPLDQSER